MRTPLFSVLLIFGLTLSCQQEQPRSVGWIRPGSATSIEFGGAFLDAYGWRIQNRIDTTYYFRLVFYEKYLGPVLDAENRVSDFKGKGNFLSLYFHSAHPLKPAEKALRLKAYDYQESRYPPGAVEQCYIEYEYGGAYTEPVSYRDRRNELTKGKLLMESIGPSQYRFEGANLQNYFAEPVQLFYQGPVYLNDRR